MNSIDTSLSLHTTDHLLQLLSGLLNESDRKSINDRINIKNQLSSRILNDDQLTTLRLLLIKELGNEPIQTHESLLKPNAINPKNDAIEDEDTEGVDEESMSFFQRNRTIFLAILITIILLMPSIYFLFFYSNIEKEATKVADRYCECQKQSNLKGISLKEDFKKSIENSNDITQLNQDLASINKTVEIIANEAILFNNMIRNQIKNEGNLLKFDQLVEQKRSLCADINAQKYKELSDGCDNLLMIKNLKSQVVSTQVFEVRNSLDDMEFGTIVIEKQTVNVRDNPDKVNGQVLYQVYQGMRFELLSEGLDDRGVYWYMIKNTEGVSGWVSNMVTNLEGLSARVNKPQTYFHSWDETTNIATPVRAYLEMNDQVQVLKRIKDYIYTEFTNNAGITTKGWLKMEDLTVD